MRTFARFVVSFAAAAGLAMAFAPAAGAATTAFPGLPVIQPVHFYTSFYITSPCNGSAVDTTGQGTVTTATERQHTTIVIVDHESGDGYQFVTQGDEVFDALASEYVVAVRGVWINRDLGLDFHSSFNEVVTVNSRNAATSFIAYNVTGTCDI